MEKITAAEYSAAELRGYSRLNKRLQFIFWDAVANPMGLRPSGGGIGAGIGL